MHRMGSPARRRKGTKEDGKKKEEVGRADRLKSGKEEAMDVDKGKP
jgi:hypothetical protein